MKKKCKLLRISWEFLIQQLTVGTNLEGAKLLSLFDVNHEQETIAMKIFHEDFEDIPEAQEIPWIEDTLYSLKTPTYPESDTGHIIMDTYWFPGSGYHDGDRWHCTHD